MRALEVRQILRQAVRQPAFTLLVVLTFSLGIGLNTALFSVVHALLLKDLPGFETDRIMVIWARTPAADFNSVDGPTITEWRKQAKSFESIEAGAFNPYTFTSSTSAPQVIRGLLATSGYFQLYRTKAALGRVFHSSELGALLLWPAHGLLQSHLFRVDAFDPGSWLLAAFAIVSMAVAAAAIPAWRAARVDPATALRNDGRS